MKGDRLFCEIGMLLLKLWNEGEVSIPPLRVGLNTFSIQLLQIDQLDRVECTCS